MNNTAICAAGILLATVSFGASADCTSNQDGVYGCSHVELLGSLTRVQMGGIDDHTHLANDMWGWTDPADGKEYVIQGMFAGTAFVDISDPENPRYLGRLESPPATPPADKTSPPRMMKCHDGCTTPGSEEEQTSSWQDVKVYGHYAYIVSEQDWFGMLVFDLHNLRGVTTPQIFTPTNHVTTFRNAHNLFIHEETGFAYVIGNTVPDSEFPGAEPNFGGLLVFDLADPANPVEAADYETDGYFHDVACVIYHGPDADYQDREICFASNSGSRKDMDPGSPDYGRTLYYNEHSGTYRSDWTFVDPTPGDPYDYENDYFDWPDTPDTFRPFTSDRYSQLTVLDVTDKNDIRHLSHDQHPDSTYVHQSWPSDDHRYLFVNDELEEGSYGYRTRSYTYDLADLDAIKHVATYKSPNLAIDHNEYVKGRLIFQSNYDSGLRILDASDPLHLVEVGFFDSQPASDQPIFEGTWSNYPYFESGVVAFSDMYTGLFIVRPYLEEASELGSDIATGAALLDGAGGDHTYHFAVANNGPGVAEEVDVTLHLPWDAAFTAITDDAGASCSAAGRKVVCQLATLASCSTELFSLTLGGGTAETTEIIGMAAAKQLDPEGRTEDNRRTLTVADRQAEVDTTALQAGLIGPACSSVPVVDAGDDQRVTAGVVVQLIAEGSDIAPLTYQWEQTGGDAVSLTSTDTVATSFTAPNLRRAADLTFQVTATNAYGATATDTVVVKVLPQTANENAGGGAFGWWLALGLLALIPRRRRD